jgi:hypothetical protein
MSYSYDALPNSCEMAFAPQLAVTGLLYEALHAASLSLRAAHPEIADPSTRFLRPSAEIAKTLLPQLHLLSNLLARYRSVLGAERSHPWAVPHLPASSKPTDEEPF